jgi:nucleoside-diphosphate-sugar epimerase
MSHVVVVGGGGFVGRHLLRHLTATGAIVHATCRPGATVEAIPGVQWIEADLTRADATAHWPQTCDTVIYLAQSRLWRPFPDGANDVFQVNVTGTFKAAEYARTAGARRLIYSSSGSVYPALDRPHTEADRFDIPGRLAFYAAAKLAAELLLGPYASLFPVIVLRLFVPYGQGQSPEMLLPKLVSRVRDGAPIVLDGDHGLRLNPVAIADVSEAIVRCLAIDRSLTMNVAGPDLLTLREVGEAIGAQLGRAPVFDVRPGTVAPTLAGDTALLRNTLGWSPTRTLADGLREWLG